MDEGIAQQYLTDPVFHRAVDLNYELIRKHGLTPLELRNAATFASILYQQQHCASLFELVNFKESHNG